jgi:hypothetical protein
MKQALIVGLVAVVVGCSPSFAQVSGSGSSASGMGLTSPLTMLPGSPVPPTGNPMGATEMAMPGISPPPLTPGNMNCPSAGSSMPGGSSTSTGLFDGGGMGGASSTSCAGTSSATSSMSSASSSPFTLSKSPGGGVGIPLGSTQLSDQGVSPMPVAPMTTLTPILPLSTGGAVPMLTVPPSMNTSPIAPATEGSILSQGIFPCPHSRSAPLPGGC